MKFKTKLYQAFSLLKWEKSFLKMVLMVSVPILLQSLVGQSLNLVDNVMVSQLGDLAYAGVAQANRFTLVVYVMLFGVSTGSGIFIAQFWGAQQIDNMKKANGLGILWGLIISVSMMVFMMIKTDLIMSLFLPAGKSAEYGRQYLYAIAPMFPILSVSNAYATLLKSEEKTKYPMISGIVAMLLNTFLNYLLIDGHLGFPRLEVVGAAIATTVSCFVGLIINIYFAYAKSVSGKATIKELFGFDMEFIKHFNKTVSPVILNETFWSIGTASFGIFFGMRGDIAVAAMGVYNTVDGLAFITMYALMNAASIIVGKALGSGDKEQAVLYAKRLIAGTMLFSMLSGFLVILFRNPLMSIFSNLSAQTLELAMKIIIISVMFSWVRGYNAILIVGILRSGGDTVASLVIDSVFLWGVTIPLLAILTKFTDFPIYILYAFTLIDEVLKFIFGRIRFKSRKWVNNLTEKTVEV